MKKVILSSNIHHYNYTARKLQEMGILKKYITEAQFGKELRFTKLLPKVLKSYLKDRVDENLDEDKITSLWFLEFIYKFILKKANNKERIILLHNYIFDKVVSKMVDNCDIFHFVSSVGYSSALVAKENGAKIIVDERGEHPLFLEDILNEELTLLNNNERYNVYWKDAVLKEYDLANYFIVPSKFVKRTFIQQGISSEKIFIVPYGCNTSKFYPIGKNDDIFRVISVGQITPRKGTRYLIEAFKKLDVKNTELILIGSIDPSMEFMMNNLPSNIKHLPYVPNSELNKYYSNSSVFVLASLSDAFPLVVLEAMGAGLPVIVTENVGSSDMIEDGKEGYIVPIMDSNSIFEKLKELYNNADLLKNMSENSLRKIEKYTWLNYMHKLEEIYQEILNH